MAHYFTKEGLEKLKKELKELQTTEMRRITKLIAEAAAFGDLKENSAYHEARNMKSFLLGRIEQLENAINEAVVREKQDTGRVQIDSRVDILLDGVKEEFHIVASTEADILKNKISYLSPLGSQLMNRKAGEGFDYEIRNKKMRVKILKIS